jgi:ribosomal protein L5
VGGVVLPLNFESNISLLRTTVTKMTAMTTMTMKTMMTTMTVMTMMTAMTMTTTKFRGKIRIWKFRKSTVGLRIQLRKRKTRIWFFRIRLFELP